MKESRSIIVSNTIAIMVLLLTIVLAGLKINANGIVVILIFLSIGLTFTGTILTFLHWKKITIGIRIIGILPFVIWLIVIAIFFYVASHSD